MSPVNPPPPPLPLGPFTLFYADPPWQYRFCETKSRRIENHYSTMKLSAICALQVKQLAAKDAILFCWATSPKLGEAMEVIAAWGFDYKSCMIWDKDRIGMGYYARQQHELLLIATTGSPGTPLPSERPKSVLHYPRGKHSAKPPEVRALLERMYPCATRLELFARGAFPGWTTWGDDPSANQLGLVNPSRCAVCGTTAVACPGMTCPGCRGAGSTT